jgi:formate dehydrogenase maturation protein FdhE
VIVLCPRCAEIPPSSWFVSRTGVRFRVCSLCRCREKIRKLQSEEARLVAARETRAHYHRATRDHQRAAAGEQEES